MQPRHTRTAPGIDGLSCDFSQKKCIRCSCAELQPNLRGSRGVVQLIPDISRYSLIPRSKKRMMPSMMPNSKVNSISRGNLTRLHSTTQLHSNALTQSNEWRDLQTRHMARVPKEITHSAANNESNFPMSSKLLEDKVRRTKIETSVSKLCSAGTGAPATMVVYNGVVLSTLNGGKAPSQ